MKKLKMILIFKNLFKFTKDIKSWRQRCKKEKFRLLSTLRDLKKI